ncbi:hypothetical protein EDB86DRAFT_2268493 [Lactarius hatsudake]|nr:hypothetical protein EDB86DRAFT_2268493 [Lactarius hatsudake]
MRIVDVPDSHEFGQNGMWDRVRDQLTANLAQSGQQPQHLEPPRRSHSPCSQARLRYQNYRRHAHQVSSASTPSPAMWSRSRCPSFLTSTTPAPSPNEGTGGSHITFATPFVWVWDLVKEEFPGANLYFDNLQEFLADVA